VTGSQLHASSRGNSIKDFVKRAQAALLALLAFAALALPATAGPRDKLDRIEGRRESVRHGIARAGARADDLRARIARLDRRASSLQERVAALDAEIAELDSRIDKVSKQLQEARERFNRLTHELMGAEDRLSERIKLFQKRAVDSYMAGTEGYVEGILSAESFADLSDRYQYFESTLDADADLIEEIERLRAEIADQREQVEREKERIAAAKESLEADRARVAEIRAEKKQALVEQRRLIGAKQELLQGQIARRSELLALEQELTDESERIEDLIAGRAAAREAAQEEAASPPSQSAASTGGQLGWPASGPVTSGFGLRVHPIFGTTRMHTGLDIGAGYGSAVGAAESGTVTFTGVMSGYGNVVIVDHGGGLSTTYNHLSGFSVSTGQSVSRGQQVGSVGCTGYCTGPHLHFEVRVGGNPVDPMPYLQ
jgi:murein DD-endopeptidase MepM/ murein hydrolase activator NlpD